MSQGNTMDCWPVIGLWNGYGNKPIQALWKFMPLPTFLSAIMNTRGNKTPKTFINFDINYDFRCRLLLIKYFILHSSLHNAMLWHQNTFTIVHDLLKFKFNWHRQIHMGGFSDIANLLGCLPGVALYLQRGTLGTSPVKQESR